MEKTIVEDIIYKNITSAAIEGRDKVFERCTFLSCDLSYADFSHQLFIDCKLENCNVSLMNVANTGFQNVTFADCKVSGVNFSNCKDFSFSVGFSRCILDYSNFYRKKLKTGAFTESSLVEVDFTESDLTGSVFENCNLDRAIFNRTVLKGADFTTASYFNIDPESNNITRAKFNSAGLAGLLSKYDLVIQ